MRRSNVASLLFIAVLAIGSLAAVLAAGYGPKLGLDLQGGAYVVLQPERSVPSDVLDKAADIIRSRVDALGVAEPDITRQGGSIIVQLPGVKDQRRALEIVGRTAQLRFRPVLAVLPAEDADATTTTTAAADDAPPEGGATTTTEPAPPDGGATTTTTIAEGVTPAEADLPEAEVILPELDDDGDVVRRYQLGPTTAVGSIVRSARAEPPQGLTGDWRVSVTLTRAGLDRFNEISRACFNQTPTCPTKQVAIVLDAVVHSAPAVQSETFDGDIEITGQFREREARDLALVLRFGSLPIELEPQSTQTVSATLGSDSLRAGVVAGLLGLGLVLLYILAYYRALGLVVIIGLGLSAMLMWSLIALLGETRGLALTLAGAVGIIVSVGVTVDSYIVYFERLKDEIRAGRSVRSSVDRSFTRAYRTILAADFSSLIGATILWLLTVGSVRGFAFFLGISTLLDLLIAFAFTRPMVALLGRSRFFTEAPFFGVARGLAAREPSS